METANNNSENKEMHISKVLNAPIELVWKVWTNPDHIAEWWGPDGFSNIIHKMDIKAGGEWKLTMKGPDGKTYPNRSVFLEIVPYEKIVFEHFNPNYIATVIFTQKHYETLLDWKMTFETKELYETVVKVFKADIGLKQNVEKLNVYLESVN